VRATGNALNVADEISGPRVNHRKAITMSDEDPVGLTVVRDIVPAIRRSERHALGECVGRNWRSGSCECGERDKGEDNKFHAASPSFGFIAYGSRV
jgi:hypothetical protein